MANKESVNLGKLQAVYPIAPAHLQKAFILIILSFMFFMAMLIAFSIRQNIGYFLLSTAFLITQLFTLFSWLNQRKIQVKIFENGLSFKKFSAFWNEIETVKTDSSDKVSCEIIKKNGEKIAFNETIYNVREIIRTVTEKAKV